MAGVANPVNTFSADDANTFGPEPFQARLDLIRDKLDEKIDEPLVIELEAIPVDILRFRSETDGDED